ncbi:hypothetical protein SELMODRAFT_424838 [Selaginella moellendorffii]|uniref:Protein kinase domain-containing protein n=1 Tax=Selaginella moellendorffii TaxID=88036 RepID=D8SR64_SELML|nr:hypothetical protein SELMODRAFT_424838 [Selaginella moellendorffii]
MEITPDEEDISMESFLWSQVSAGFENDDDMKEKLVHRLDRYLGERIHREIRLENCSCDGIIISRKEPRILFRFKSELGAGDPCFEVLGYIRNWVSQETKAGRKASFYGLCISVVCPYIQVAGYVYDSASDTIEMEPLTDIVCVYGPRQNRGRVAKLLHGIKEFLRLDLATGGPVNLPYLLWNYKNVQVVDAESLVFKFEDHHGCRKIAKFVVYNSYGIEAHHAWAANGMAPALTELKAATPPFYMAVMDCLAEEDGWRSCVDLVRDWKLNSSMDKVAKLQDIVKHRVQKCHDDGFVHGDLRLTNLMCKEEANGNLEVKALDFDWSGEKGKAMYPTILNDKIKWHPDVKYRALIHAEHDLWFVDRLVEQLDELFISDIVPLPRIESMEGMLMESGQDSPTLIGNLLVKMYGDCGDAWAASQRIASRNVFSWNILMAASADGENEKPAAIFLVMSERDVCSWNSFVPANAQSGHRDKAILAFLKMPKTQSTTWNAIVSAYGDNKRIPEAKAMLDRMVKETPRHGTQSSPHMP